MVGRQGEEDGTDGRGVLGGRGADCEGGRGLVAGLDVGEAGAKRGVFVRLFTLAWTWLAGAIEVLGDGGRRLTGGALVEAVLDLPPLSGIGDP